VGNIKSKFCTLIIYTIILSIILLFSFVEIINAEENPFEISIVDEPTYKLTKIIERNGRIIGKSYQISIILTNTGYQKTDQIEINMSDQEGFVLTQRTFINAGETKTITFNWSTIKIINQELKINYYPSDLDTPLNKYNSGQKIFKIKIAENGMPGTSTPGFEIILLIISILVVTFKFKRKT